MKSAPHLRGKRILITGGTGTFGYAMVRQLLGISGIDKIIILSRDEFKQHEMLREFGGERLSFFLGDVRDLSRLTRAFNDIDIVIHAAALKQVPALEYNPLEAVKTNILGTQNVIDAALDRNVDRVIFVSSDKAVHPINLYGATKLTAERLVIASNVYRGEKGKTKLSVIRYGNVIGSRGSLVELIEKQRPTGVITLTDERMTRFWIYIDEVTKVVVNVLKLMQGGEIFVPKMKSLHIIDVIKRLAPECRIKTIGIRAGEKLHETLLTEHEISRTKDLGDMFVILPEFKNWSGKSTFSKSKPFPKDSLYFSNHPDYLLSGRHVKKIIKI